jgi:hypothetical protein
MVQEVLGHSSVTVTIDVYSYVLPDMQEKVTASQWTICSRNSANYREPLGCHQGLSY